METCAQYDSARWLLERAALLYERHGAGKQETFNIFSVLRAESDEENLHSRFLVALLSHRKLDDTSPRNLEDFLCAIAGVDRVRLDGAEVERELHNIDILIRNSSSREAVVIENKIWAHDQPRQMARYAEHMENIGYHPPYLLYLTLDGRDPDEGSAGGRDVTSVSYRDLIPWLERCQERAYGEPALRESIAQYIQLVRKLTGTDLKGDYMAELSKLILDDNNLVLVHDLHEAMFEAKVSLLTTFWKEIDRAVRDRMPDLPERTEESVSQENIRKFLKKQRGNYYHGLYYNFKKGVKLIVEIEHSHMYFGVYCSNNRSKKKFRRLRALLEGLGDNAGPEESYPWYQWIRGDLNFRYPTRQNLVLLGGVRARNKYAEEIADGLSRVWDKMRDYSAGSAQGS